MRGEERDEQAFVERLQALLERSADELDLETRRRLADARRRALEAAVERRSVLRWLPLGATTVAAGLALALLLWRRGSSLPPEADALEEVDLLASAPDLDLYEDLDFFLWLSEESKDA